MQVAGLNESIINWTFAANWRDDHAMIILKGA